MDNLTQSEARKQAQVAACRLEFEGASRALAQSEEQLQAACAENEGLLKNLMLTEAQVAAYKLEFESALGASGPLRKVRSTYKRRMPKTKASSGL